MSDKLSEHDKETQQGKGGKTPLIICIVICIAVIIVLSVAIILIAGGKEEEAPLRNVVINKENVEDVIDEMLQQEFIPQGYYSVRMNTTWYFSTGDAISENAIVENVVENTNDVYFDVFLADNEDEPIYQSPVLPRGSKLESIALDKELPTGTYDCIMVYHLIDEEQNTLSTLRVGFTIVVEQ